MCELPQASYELWNRVCELPKASCDLWNRLCELMTKFNDPNEGSERQDFELANKGGTDSGFAKILRCLTNFEIRMRVRGGWILN